MPDLTTALAFGWCTSAEGMYQKAHAGNPACQNSMLQNATERAMCLSSTDLTRDTTVAAQQVVCTQAALQIEEATLNLQGQTSTIG